MQKVTEIYTFSSLPSTATAAVAIESGEKARRRSK
jgi:hypothetical protein